MQIVIVGAGRADLVAQTKARRGGGVSLAACAEIARQSVEFPLKGMRF